MSEGCQSYLHQDIGATTAHINKLGAVHCSVTVTTSLWAVYGKSSKTSNTGCLLKRSRQTRHASEKQSDQVLLYLLFKQGRPRSDYFWKSDQGLPCFIFWQAFCKFQPLKLTFSWRTDSLFNLILTRFRLGFSQICNTVMALDWCQNFISAQFLENKWMDFYQILYMHLNWQDLAWDCYSPWLIIFSSWKVLQQILWQF